MDPFERIHYLNNYILNNCVQRLYAYLWEFSLNTLLILLYTAKSLILSVTFNVTTSISIPADLLRLEISDCYNKLLI